MDKIAIAKTLLKYIGKDSIEADWALAQGIIVILDTFEDEKPKPASKPTAPMEREARPKQTKPKPGRKPFDTGKLGALRKAGWSVIKIADEMQVSEQTVRNYMKKEGIA